VSLCPDVPESARSSASNLSTPTNMQHEAAVVPPTRARRAASGRLEHSGKALAGLNPAIRGSKSNGKAGGADSGRSGRRPQI